MRFEVVRSIEARNDLRAIARYTKKEWGMAQVECYLQDLQQTIESLAHAPESKGRDLNYHHTGLRRISHRHHYHIFYRVSGEMV